MGNPKLPPAATEETTEEFVELTAEQIGALPMAEQVAYYRSKSEAGDSEIESLKKRKSKSAKTAFLKEALDSVGFSWKQPGSLGHLLTAFDPDICKDSRDSLEAVSLEREAVRDQLFDAEGKQLSSVDGEALWRAMAEYHHAVKGLATARDDGHYGLPWATNAVVCIGGAGELIAKKREIDKA